jgi:membrane-bound lytic murein transglycosylase C
MRSFIPSTVLTKLPGFKITTRLLMWLSASLLFGCNAANIRTLGVLADDPAAAATQVLQSKARQYAANPTQLPADLKAYQTRIKKFVSLISAIWGEEDATQAGPKDYVKYTDKYYNRAHINFETGTVTIETLAPDSQETYLKKAIITTLLTPDDPRHVDLYSDASPVGKGKPFLYEQVLDHDAKPIEWQWRANRYAEYLIKNKLEKVNIGKRGGLRVVFPLIARHEQVRAYKYASLVQKYSKKYNVNESLIYSIIKTESSFNPFAVSSAPAYGLMQIVPGTAGRDVFEKIKKRAGQPSPQNLYQPEYNIDIGTAYIQILQEQYLAKINDQNARRYSVISAYNGGAGNVLKTFSSDRDLAVVKINQLPPNEVYQHLTNKHPQQESRRYLVKVTKAQQEFWRSKGFSK